MNKPWTVDTFPKDRPVYVCPKENMTGGGALVQMIAVLGVAIIEGGHKDKAQFRTMSWMELYASCIQWDGKVCGVET